MTTAIISVPKELREQKSKLIEKIKETLGKKEIPHTTIYTCDGTRVKVRYQRMTYTAENLHLI